MMEHKSCTFLYMSRGVVKDKGINKEFSRGVVSDDET
jgi:hypothetical protein